MSDATPVGSQGAAPASKSASEAEPVVSQASSPASKPAAAPVGPQGASPASKSSTAPAPASAAPPTGVTTGAKTWNNVNQPGSYVCNDTGLLLRVPAAGIKDGTSPIIDFFGPQGPVNVTRLSENPGLPIADLRTLATTAQIKPQF